MADPCPKMPAGYHRDRMNLPDQPDHQGGGVQGCTQLLLPAAIDSRIPGQRTNTHFSKNIKVPLHPSTPSPLQQSHWTVGKTGEREPFYLFNGLTFRFAEQSTKIPHAP